MSRARDLADAGSKANYLDNVTEDLNTALVSVEGTEIKSTGVTGTQKFLRVDGDNSSSWQIAVPVGSIFSMAFTPDGTWLSTNGYLICDGSSLNSSTDTEYADLYSVIGTTWGGSSASAFNIPDLKGAYLRGVGTSTVFTQDQAITLAQTINDQFQAHEHSYTYWGWQISTGYAGGKSYVLNDQSTMNATITTHNGALTSGSNGTPRTGNETRPNSRGVQYIIKY